MAVRQVLILLLWSTPSVLHGLERWELSLPYSVWWLLQSQVVTQLSVVHDLLQQTSCITSRTRFTSVSYSPCQSSLLQECLCVSTSPSCGVTLHGSTRHCQHSRFGLLPCGYIIVGASVRDSCVTDGYLRLFLIYCRY